MRALSAGSYVRGVEDGADTPEEPQSLDLIVGDRRMAKVVSEFKLGRQPQQPLAPLPRRTPCAEDPGDPLPPAA